MSSSSSDESSAVFGVHSASSGVSSTASLLFSHPSEFSDVQTEITPPNSPTGNGLHKTSRSLAQVHIWPSQPEATPSREIRIRPLLPPSSLNNDESGYESDGDVRGTALGKPTLAGRRPRVSRVPDPKLRNRTPSHLARAPAGITDTLTIPRASPNSNLRVDTSIESKPSHRHVLPSSSSLTHIADHEAERRTRKAGIGLGLGLPPNHPLRTRAFTMPRLSPTSSTESNSPPAEEEEGKLLPSRPFPPILEGPPKLSMRPTTLDTSPSPIELLPPSVVCYTPDDDDGPAVGSLSVVTEHAFILGESIVPPTALKDDTILRYDTAPALVLDMPRFGENGAPSDTIAGEGFSSYVSYT